MLSGTITTEIIPYCLRLTDNSFIANTNFTIADSKFTFAELREENITSEQLLSWLATIDQAELYQMFLNTGRNLPSSLEGEIAFYNCTPPWFGPYCRVAFDPPEGALVGSSDRFYTNPLRSFELGYLTCYEHLHCDRWFPCLDWRHICDRKADCFDGSDELNCWQLEMNECAANEYRCHNGQCIPKEFFRDNPSYPDCMDQTDEFREAGAYICPHSPTFECESYVCRPDEGFSCRDGLCEFDSPIETHFCRIEIDKYLIDDLCSMTIGCCMGIQDSSREHECVQLCPNGICPKTNCPPLYQFPAYPILYGHVRFLYESKVRSWSNYEIALPDYVCYDENRCSDFLSPTIRLNNLTCRPLSQIGLKNEIRYAKMNLFLKDLKNLFRRCLITLDEKDHCNSSTMYQCLNSSKCISLSRLLDRIQDCPFNDDETFNNSCSLNDHQYRVRCSINGTIQCLSSFTCPEDRKLFIPTWEDQHAEKILVIDEQIFFSMICDGIERFSPLLINGKNETDETECENWPCNNPYTRCDGNWQCENGIDELKCPPDICLESGHKCIYPNNTRKISCIPMNRINDGIVDCLGGTDERNFCRRKYPDSDDANKRFRCWNDTECIQLEDVCALNKECKYGDDESLCLKRGPCMRPFDKRTDFERFICSLNDQTKQTNIYLRLSSMPNYSSI